MHHFLIWDLDATWTKKLHPKVLNGGIYTTELSSYKCFVLGLECSTVNYIM